MANETPNPLSKGAEDADFDAEAGTKPSTRSQLTDEFHMCGINCTRAAQATNVGLDLTEHIISVDQLWYFYVAYAIVGLLCMIGCAHALPAAPRFTAAAAAAAQRGAPPRSPSAADARPAAPPRPAPPPPRPRTATPHVC